MAFLGYSNVQIKWTLEDNSLGNVVSTNNRQSNTTWTDIYTNNFYAEDLLSLELTLEASESLILDFSTLSYERLGFELVKAWTTLKFLYVENFSEADYLEIGDSGLSDSLGIVCDDANIGPEGIYVYVDKAGIPISSTRKNFRLVNNNADPISIRIVAAGEL